MRMHWNSSRGNHDTSPLRPSRPRLFPCRVRNSCQVLLHAEYVCIQHTCRCIAGDLSVSIPDPLRANPLHPVAESTWILFDYAAPSKVAISHRQLNSSADLIAFKVCPSSRFDHGLVNLRSSGWACRNRPHKASLTIRVPSVFRFWMVIEFESPLRIEAKPIWKCQSAQVILTVVVGMRPRVLPPSPSRGPRQLKPPWNFLPLEASTGQDEKNIICTVYSWRHWEYSIRSCKHTPKYLAVRCLSSTVSDKSSLCKICLTSSKLLRNCCLDMSRSPAGNILPSQ